MASNLVGVTKNVSARANVAAPVAVANNDTNYINSIKSLEKLVSLIMPSKPKTEMLHPRLQKFLPALAEKKYAAESLIQIKTFLEGLVVLVNHSEGHGGSLNELTKPGVYEGKCMFLDTTASEGAGCKIDTQPKKLMYYMRFLLDSTVDLLKLMPDDVKSKFDEDETTMKAFDKAIRTMFYFFTSKQVGSVLCQTKLLTSFIEQVNTIFERQIIRVICPDICNYGCGRIVTLSKCEASKKYFIVIGESDKESGGQTPASAISMVNSSTSCGGRRKKTRRMKRKAKKTRKSKTRKH
jgi:hypothetical protein